MFLNTWGFFYLEKIMSKYSATKDTCDKMLDELINMLIDAKENNGYGVQMLEISTDISCSESLPTYKIGLTLVKYK